MTPVIFLMGTTCSGKGTFCTYAKKVLRSEVAIISIGDEMRRRHPDPDYFKGKAALEETQDEVEEIYTEQMTRAAMSDAKIIICDGQPRLPRAVDHIFKNPQPFWDFRFIILHASAEARRRRIDKRFPEPMRVGSSDDGSEFKKVHDTWKSNVALAEARITNDNIQLFDVWAYLSLRGYPVAVVDTSAPAETYQHRLLKMICGE